MKFKNKDPRVQSTIKIYRRIDQYAANGSCLNVHAVSPFRAPSWSSLDSDVRSTQKFHGNVLSSGSGYNEKRNAIH
ncbi:hypothetical protein EVAR_230_1 [Eumeta japonica]|uniref:Uncharacterized protein n=1 Tax=Eumeta variegata TaxID=151549 RepID=A0A4C1SC21_EUMVA|nr:hypothetical protein EVAR_230_1 [Eumeta japonica]